MDRLVDRRAESNVAIVRDDAHTAAGMLRLKHTFLSAVVDDNHLKALEGLLLQRPQAVGERIVGGQRRHNYSD